MDALLLLRNIRVENANAIAGMTWGFPSLSGFLGFSHALHRKVQGVMENAPEFEGCAVICHEHHIHTHKATPLSDSVFSLTRNPLTKKGNTASFNEEGRMHLTVTLMIGVNDLPDLNDDELEHLQQRLFTLASQQRLAGGTIVSLAKAEIIENVSQYSDRCKLKRLMRSLLPGFALVSRDDVLQQHQQETGQDALDAWLDFSELTYRAVPDGREKEKAKWSLQRPPFSGWLKPITIGYRSISDLFVPGTVTKCRDYKTPVRFVESIYSLGQWLSPHRITELTHLFWYHHYQPESGLYLCKNNYQAPQNEHSTIDE
ncbi:MAG: type I-F CRISPR-associated protein Csy2 [Reinekea sp.]